MFQAGSVEIKILHESISEYKLDLAATVWSLEFPP